MTIDELETRFRSLDQELKRKNITRRTKEGQTKNINNFVKGNMYKGLFDRTQGKMLEDFEKRKHKLNLETEKIMDYFDLVHYAYAIMVYQEVLLEIDHNTDLSGNITGKVAGYWEERARDKAQRYRENFQRANTKTLYQDFLILLDGSPKEREMRQNTMPMMLNDIARIYHLTFDKTKFKEDYPFDIGKPKVENINIIPRNIPQSSKIQKDKYSSKPVAIQISLFDGLDEPDKPIIK